ncbi:MAG: CARDB domain-containing protein [Myxococcota bacterium]|nr:CARDB domain-containing protein [Myxococcota bacterium]
MLYAAACVGGDHQPDSDVGGEAAADDAGPVEDDGGGSESDVDGTDTSPGRVDLYVGTVRYLDCCANASPFTIDVKILNRGTVAAGPFRVEGYLSPDDQIDSVPTGPPAGDTVLFTWTVESVAPLPVNGIARRFTVSFEGYPVAVEYYRIIIVDPDDEVRETNEGNNTMTSSFLLER